MANDVLPLPLAPAITVGANGEFVRRISQRTGLNETETSQGVAAVLTVLSGVITSDAFDHAMSQLPAEFRQLVEAPE